MKIAIIVPTKAGDGFAIAQYLQENLNESFASALPIGLFAYERDPADASDLTSLVNLRPRTDPPEIPRGVGRSVFWGYWRDLAQHDVLFILTAIDAQDNASFDDAFRYFWKNYLTTGRALTWEGNTRKAKQPNAPSYNAEKLNAYYSLRHSGIINPDGALTESGYQLLRLNQTL